MVAIRERLNISEARKRFSSLLKNVQREPDVVYEITVNDIVVGELRAPERSGYRVGTGRDLLAALAKMGEPEEDEPAKDPSGDRRSTARDHDLHLYGGRS